MLNCCGNEINPRERRVVFFLPSGHGLGVHANLTCGYFHQVRKCGSTFCAHTWLPSPLSPTATAADETVTRLTLSDAHVFCFLYHP